MQKLLKSFFLFRDTVSVRLKQQGVSTRSWKYNNESLIKESTGEWDWVAIQSMNSVDICPIQILWDWELDASSEDPHPLDTGYYGLLDSNESGEMQISKLNLGDSNVTATSSGLRMQIAVERAHAGKTSLLFIEWVSRSLIDRIFLRKGSVIYRKAVLVLKSDHFRGVSHRFWKKLIRKLMLIHYVDGH
jgi:hypothetical protein